jgi:hypothetical protein
MAMNSYAIRLTPEINKVVSFQRQVVLDLQKVWENLADELIWPPRKVPELRPLPATAAALCMEGRELLAKPATNDEIRIAMTILDKSFKYPGHKVIADQEGFLTMLHQHLSGETGGRYPSCVLYRMAWIAPEQFKWITSIEEAVAVCNKVKSDMLAAIRYLEAPHEVRFQVAYEVTAELCDRRHAAKELARFERERRQEAEWEAIDQAKRAAEQRSGRIILTRPSR